VGAVGSASAKLILFGEHAAVHGYPALGVSLPERTTVRFLGAPGSAWDLDALMREDRDSVARVLTFLERELASLPRTAVRIESDVARGVGFGSSAALCASLAKAALALAGELDAPVSRVWHVAHEAERIFHGTPSGIDTGLALLDGMFSFDARPPGLPLARALAGPPLHLVVAAVPRAASCAALVASVSQRMRDGHRPTRESMERLGGIAHDAREVLREARPDAPERIGRLADEAMGSLRRLGLSSPALEMLLDAGRAHGALGGKLSGAGSGGALFLVAKDAESAAVIARALQEHADRAALPMVSRPRVVETPGATGSAPRE
jgi:mevalonate kinase